MKTRRDMGLKRTLLLYFIPLSLVPLTLLGIWAVSTAWHNARNSAQNWVQSRPNLFVAKTEMIKQKNKLKLSLISKSMPHFQPQEVLEEGDYLLAWDHYGKASLLWPAVNNFFPPNLRVSEDFNRIGNSLFFCSSASLASGKYGTIAVLKIIDDEFAETFRKFTNTEISFYLGTELAATTWKDIDGRRIKAKLDNETKEHLRNLTTDKVYFGRGEYHVPNYRGISMRFSKNDMFHRGESRFHAFQVFKPIADQQGNVIGFFSAAVPEDLLMAGPKKMLLVFTIGFLIIAGISTWFIIWVAETRITVRFIKPLRSFGEEIFLLAGQLPGQKPRTQKLSDSDHEMALLGSSLVTLREALESSEDLFERVSRFSYDIAHELRTPLNNIRGELEVAQRYPRTWGECQEIFASATDEVEKMTQLINQLLFLARAENPKTAIQRVRINIGDELSKLAEFYDAEASQKGVRIEIHSSGDILADVDKPLFQRAVCNVIENAIEHTDNGGVITILAKSDTLLQVSISDTGRGIAKEHLPRIFDRFYRADGLASSKRVGLGLSIVRTITKLHGGSTNIVSEVGRGTAVTMAFA